MYTPFPRVVYSHNSPIGTKYNRNYYLPQDFLSRKEKVKEETQKQTQRGI